MAQEPGKLDCEGNPEVGVDGSRTVRDGLGLRDQAVASRHPRLGECQRGQEAVPKLVCLGVWNPAIDRGFARADGAHSSDDQRALGGNLGNWTRGLAITFMEGLNSLFSVKRRSPGYRTVKYLKAMLYFVAGKRTLLCY